MKPNTHSLKSVRSLALTMVASGCLMILGAPLAHATSTVSFLGVAAGDASTSDVTVWTRATDSANVGSAVTVTLQVSTDNTFGTVLTSQDLTTTTASVGDNTCKANLTGLAAATRYYFRFVAKDDTSNTSLVGTFKTAPTATTNYPLHFAFSGDMDGLMRPYALSSRVPLENLDFYLNCGDVIYETASNLSATGTNGAAWLNSPAVTISGASASLNGVPDAGTSYATQAQLFTDYSKKYREQFLAVNTSGQNGLQTFYAGQSNYTLSDNHELGNRQYINGGAPAGGSVGGSAGTDMTSGRGVDARNGGSGNSGNVNDAADALSSGALSSLGGFMNKATGFTTLQNVFMNYQPIKDRGTVSASGDPRTDGTKQLYFSQQWGRHSLYIQTDARSYRDIRLKTANGSADDTGSRADNANRKYLGATQVAWLKQQLLNAEQAGTTWKFIAISDPIDQIGPVGSSLTSVTASAMQPYSGNSAYGPVNSDGGKAYVGGYRAERNDLLKFIADHQIKNVVFMATDDHQNRINEVTYSPSGQLSTQSSYVKVPYCFSIVCGPLGATGPDLFLNHDWNSVKGAANLIGGAQATAGVEPIGLLGYPGLHDVKRDQGGTLVAESTPQYADFYSPDTFNYNVLDVSQDGKTLTVTSKGISSTAQNAAAEYGAGGNTARTIFQFSVDAAQPLNSIDHIIVIYQENWSFDGLYGSFPGANGIANASSNSLNQIDRLTGNSISSSAGTFNFNRISQTANTPNSPLVLTSNTNSNPGTLNTPPQPLGSPTGSSVVDTRFNSNAADPNSSLSVNTLSPYLLPNFVSPTALTGDIVHRYWHEQFQIAGSYQSGGTDMSAGNNQGFVTWSDNPGLVMSRFDATSMPEGLLAQQYTMCDNFFHSAFGGSFLNHQFLVAAAPPVYDSMPSSNQGNIAYLDSNGYLMMNTSGPSTGKQIRDGNITPVAGDTLTGLTVNGTSGQSVTLTSSNAEAFSGSVGTTFDKHYAVNTIRSKNLTGNGESPAAVTTLPSLNNSNPSDSTRTYIPTIGDTLSAANVSWKWYSGGWTQITGYSGSNPSPTTSPSYATANASLQMQYHHQAFAYYDNYAPFDTTNTVPAAYVGGFAGYQPNSLSAGQSGVTRAQNSAAHLQDETVFFQDVANGTLPAVSFIKPVGINNEHPGYTSLQTGQAHVAAIVQAVQANPALWARTMIIITYDEHGGRWDHVTPPARDIWGPGVRVPCIVISPLVNKGVVDHTARDTSSILSTIEQRFGLPALNARTAAAPTFASLLTSTPITRSGFTWNRALNKFSQTVTITNNGTLPLVGPIQLVLESLSSNTALSNKTGTTVTNYTGSSYITVSSSGLAAGASASVQLLFNVPSTGTVTYTPHVVTGTPAP